ncbi:MAG: hypothetical protein IT437_01950 [Phycisphaerales bacterium]|nr:hypothetical protein [Phycisphaerales bacterium]
MVTGLAVLGLFTGLGMYQYQHRQKEVAVAAAADDLVRFQQMIQLRAATKDVPLNARGWPQTIDPAWFGESPPRNHLVSSVHPWLEVAAAEEADLQDPFVRMTIDSKKAGYWYNPNQGIVRARVPVGISDERALALYNRINGTALTTIYSKEVLPAPGAVAGQQPAEASAPVTTASVPEPVPAGGDTPPAAEPSKSSPSPPPPR